MKYLLELLSRNFKCCLARENLLRCYIWNDLNDDFLVKYNVYKRSDHFLLSCRIPFAKVTVFLRDCFVSEISWGNSKVSLVEACAGLFGAIGDVSTRKSGRARQVSVFLREPLFTLRYARVRIHFAARNRRPGICEMKEAVGPRPSPLPVAAMWTISSGSYYSDLIHRLPPISVETDRSFFHIFHSILCFLIVIIFRWIIDE